jgi:hypothetical protein
MALRIRKLDTACYVPRRYRNEVSVVDQFAHGRFAADLAGHLGPSLAHQSAVVRIKHLPLRLIIPASDLNESTLSRAWTEAFSRALFTALAYPSGTGPFEVFRADSVAGFIAGAIRDLLDGTASGKWQYAEFEGLFCSGVSPAFVTLLTNWPHLTFPILVELDQTGALSKLLPRLDDLMLERLFVILASPGDSEPPLLTIADLISVAKLVPQRPPGKLAAMWSRGFALQLYVHLRSMNQPARSPRAIFHTLTALAILLSEDLSLLSSAIHGEPDAMHLPPATVALLQIVAQEVHSTPQSIQLSELGQLLSDLRTTLKIPPPSTTNVPARWVSSDWCGLFFLTSTLARLGWVTGWRQLHDFQVGGISPLLTGLALTIAGKFETQPHALDPGVALFSGYLADPDLSYLNKVFQEYPIAVRRNVMHAALGGEDGSETWSSTFERLANHLLCQFASGIRGFKKSSPQGVASTFLQRSGRIRIEDERITIQPEPSAFHIALHIAGLDAPLDSIPWLGGRRLEFEIGDI